MRFCSDFKKLSLWLSPPTATFMSPIPDVKSPFEGLAKFSRRQRKWRRTVSESDSPPHPTLTKVRPLKKFTVPPLSRFVENVREAARRGMAALWLDSGKVPGSAGSSRFSSARFGSVQLAGPLVPVPPVLVPKLLSGCSCCGHSLASLAGRFSWPVTVPKFLG